MPQGWGLRWAGGPHATTTAPSPLLQNTFGAVAFTSYGAWWMSLSLWGILVAVRAGVYVCVCVGGGGHAWRCASCQALSVTPPSSFTPQAGIFTAAHDGLKMLFALWGCFTMSERARCMHQRRGRGATGTSSPPWTRTLPRCTPPLATPRSHERGLPGVELCSVAAVLPAGT